MSFRIDRSRPVSARQPANAGTDRRASSGQASLLPVPVGPVASAPRPDHRDSDAAYAAQLIGQDGQKRGLRGGAPVLEAARHAYATVEWSGSHDRRRRLGRTARTEA